MAASIICRGGIVACPTEFCFGLSCNPLDPLAVRKLLQIKEREPSRGFILIAAVYDQLEPYLGRITPSVRNKVLASWPGPVTWLLPARDDVPIWLNGGRSTIAVRVTAHPMAAALCRTADMALISSSANRADFPPALSALATRLRFHGQIDYVIPGSVGNELRCTTIRDAQTGKTIRP